MHSAQRRTWPWPPDDELTRLFGGAQRGEQGGLDALLARLRVSLVAYLARRIPWDDAEDWAEVGLIRIVRALRAVDPERAAPYVVRVARNLVVSACRSRLREARLSARAAVAYRIKPPVAPDLAAEYDDLIGAVHRTLRTFPPELRDVVLGTLQDLSQFDIAARQHVHPTTIRTRLLRARALLRRALRPYAEVREVYALTRSWPERFPQFRRRVVCG